MCNHKKHFSSHVIIASRQTFERKTLEKEVTLKMSDFKPLILNEDHSLVDHDLTNVYGHWLSDDSAVISQQEVKFKKKENIDSLKKSVLKHRIRILTGKDLSVIESEVKKTIDSDTDLKKLAKLLILEAAGKLPAAPVRAVVENSRKRTFEDVASEEVDEQPPIKRRPGRKSVAAFASPAVPTPKRPSRRSMMPQIPVEVQDPEEEMEEDEPVEENEEEELDLSDLGPNPTPQMIELKRKKLQAKKNGTPKKNGSPKKKLPQPSAQIKPSKILKKKEDPPKVEFSGENCNIYLVNAEEKCKFDCNGLEKITDGKFQGANLTFIHTPVSWTPSDVFATTMNIKFVNRKAGLDSYLVMVGCGIQNLHMIMEALKRHTKHVQMVVFERDDMVRKPSFFIGNAFCKDFFSRTKSLKQTISCYERRSAFSFWRIFTPIAKRRALYRHPEWFVPI